ncbi:TIGR04551 family protein [Myxococcus sp. RHSTA-1-4]|uniref:TIGR04551 family protein n=1 Tax=Myxococcus sp. RHSTA-1-4 TaxID=2874601 RepID=UPI001CC15849|nr:TIGR04551 family protein [Myxococcus sp. RHSTA-1-4]MBZ4420973.1 TIGR04551 family protein [Myxococcus sp. RHSTA-1-4]
MSHALLAALLVASSTATAQTPVPDGGTPAPAAEAAPSEAAPAPAAPPAEPPPAAAGTAQGGTVSREDLEAVREQLREEIRAEMAKQSVDSGEWKEEFPEEKRKLEVFTLDGYFRLRPTLFYKFDLGKQAGQELFPRSPRSASENTQSFATMRLRMEPTFNVSEQVSLKLEVLGLDNVVLGSQPDTLYPGDQRNLFGIFSESQDSAVDMLEDSIKIRRAYGEVKTPVGILRFGRMGSHWGLGMLRNDGTCFDCDYGDTVDRIQFVTNPFEGWYVTPMVDFNDEGVVDGRGSQGEPVDLTQSDDSHSWVIAIARRDTDAVIRSKLDNNQGVLQYGLHFTYRTQNWEYDADTTNGAATGFIPRDAALYVPDFWLKYEERTFRLEFELAAILGNIGNRALDAGGINEPSLNQSLRIAQFGGVAQGELKLANNKLSLGLELGFASGDKAAGFGNYPVRAGSGPNGVTEPGDVEGPQYRCGSGGCSDNAIRNFRFNRDYRVDLILWREIIGGVTDAFYVRPSAKYTVTEGFDLYGRLIYSQTLYAESTPSYTSRSLGVEVNVGADYKTEDGFIAGAAYGILFPMSGLQEFDPNLRDELETPQTIRGWLGINF